MALLAGMYYLYSSHNLPNFGVKFHYDLLGIFLISDTDYNPFDEPGILAL